MHTFHKFKYFIWPTFLTSYQWCVQFLTHSSYFMAKRSVKIICNWPFRCLHLLCLSIHQFLCLSQITEKNLLHFSWNYWWIIDLAPQSEWSIKILINTKLLGPLTCFYVSQRDVTHKGLIVLYQRHTMKADIHLRKSLDGVRFSNELHKRMP